MKYNQGVATLEISAAMLILLSIVISGFGVSSYLNEVRVVNSIIDRSLHDITATPFKLGAQASLLVQTTKLNSVLDEIIVSVSKGLEKSSSSSSDYFIQALYCLANIDPHSGAANGLLLSSCSSKQNGTYRPPQITLQQTDLVTDFQKYLELTQAVPGQSTERSLLAQPTGSYGRNQQSQYLKQVVLVGLRVFTSLDQKLPGSALKRLGMQPLVYNKKTTHLRGVLE